MSQSTPKQRLTAAIVGLAIAVGTVIFGKTETIAGAIDTGLNARTALDTSIGSGS